MKKIILSITFFLSFAGAYGHHLIQGMVIDAEKNTPLPGANIWFAQEGKGTIAMSLAGFNWR
ncbi:MAG: carboxypeptidase-like regulatory domain-containing protein [Cyclobacteriaceae bacterium]|nr:carboxypeptidase-like regulatory domain-containing protein [Cyclobacteriaceae bacterium]